MNLEQHLLRQMAFSRATFGPGQRRAGVIDHIKKELDEIEEIPNDMAREKEWVDVVILALDGMWRSLSFHDDGRQRHQPDHVAEKVVNLIRNKQAVNEQRDWPDWRTMSADKAIEHDRTKDADT